MSDGGVILYNKLSTEEVESLVCDLLRSERKLHEAGVKLSRSDGGITWKQENPNKFYGNTII